MDGRTDGWRTRSVVRCDGKEWWNRASIVKVCSFGVRNGKVGTIPIYDCWSKLDSDKRNKKNSSVCFIFLPSPGSHNPSAVPHTANSLVAFLHEILTNTKFNVKIECHRWISRYLTSRSITIEFRNFLLLVNGTLGWRRRDRNRTGQNGRGEGRGHKKEIHPRHATDADDDLWSSHDQNTTMVFQKVEQKEYRPY